MRNLRVTIFVTLCLMMGFFAYGQSNPISPGSSAEKAVAAPGAALPTQVKVIGAKRGATVVPLVLDPADRLLVNSATINANGSGSAAAFQVSTIATLTAPANAVGFVLMNLDTSTSNLRWSVGRVAAVNLGEQLQPGRDTGFVPIAHDVSAISEAGTCDVDIQWVIQ